MSNSVTNTFIFGGGGGTLTLPDAVTRYQSATSVVVEGNVVFGAPNSYTGNTAVSAGTLQLTNGSALPSGPGYGNVEVDANGTLDLDGNYVAVNGLSGAGTVTNSASWLGTLSVGANDETSEFDGVIQDGSNGSVALVKIGEGRLTLAGANTYSGGTTVAEGFLQVGNGGDSTGSLGTGNVNVTVNTSLVFYCGSNVTIANAISGSGSLTQEGADTLTLTGSDSCNSTMILAGTLQFGDGNTTGSLGGGAVEDNASLVFDCGSDVQVGNTISGSGSLSQISSNMLTLTGDNSYNGGTTVDAGTLQVGDTGAIPADPYTDNVEVDATLDLDGFSITINGLTGAGTVTNNASTLSTFTVGADDQTSEFDGAIEDGSGSIALVKIGAGTLDLTGANAYGGNTTVSAGTLQVASQSAIPSGAAAGNVEVDSGAELDLDGNSITINGLSGLGTVTTTVARSITLTVGANDQTSRFDGAILDGSGGITVAKTGAGTVTLTGANDYDAATVSGGLLLTGSLAPTLTVSGDSAASAEAGYTLELSSTVPLSGWVIQWGDGGNSSAGPADTSATYTYTTQGNYTITATATGAKRRHGRRDLEAPGRGRPPARLPDRNAHRRIPTGTGTTSTSI